MGNDMKKYLDIINEAWVSDEPSELDEPKGDSQSAPTLGAKYNELAKKYAPAQNLQVKPEIDDASMIDELVFRRSEYEGGMATILIKLAQEQLGR